MQRNEKQLFGAAIELFEIKDPDEFLNASTTMAKHASDSIDSGGPSGLHLDVPTRSPIADVVFHFVRLAIFYACWSVVPAFIATSAGGPVFQVTLLMWLLGMCTEGFRYFVTRSISRGTSIEIIGGFWYAFIFLLTFFIPLVEIVGGLFTRSFGNALASDSVSLLFGVFLVVVPFLASRFMAYNGFGMREALRCGTVTWRRVVLQFYTISLANFRLAGPMYFLFFALGRIPTLNAEGAWSMLYLVDDLVSFLEWLAMFLFLASPAFFACTKTNGSVARASQVVLASVIGLVLGCFAGGWAYFIGLLAIVGDGEIQYHVIQHNSMNFWFPFAVCLLFGCGVSLFPLNRFGFDEWKRRIWFYVEFALCNAVALGVVLIFRLKFHADRFLYDPPQTFLELAIQGSIYLTVFSFSLVIGYWLKSLTARGLRKTKPRFEPSILAGQFEGVGYLMPATGVRGLLFQLGAFGREFAVASVPFRLHSREQ